MRNTLEGLGVDWIAGLGEVGYLQHALCLIHAMWKAGDRKRAYRQARTIFTRGDGYKESAPSIARVQPAEYDEFAEAIDVAWPQRNGMLPRRATPPKDMPASEGLYEAWLLLEAALFSRRPYHHSYTAVQNGVNRAVASWLDCLGRTSVQHQKGH